MNWLGLAGLGSDGLLWNLLDWARLELPRLGHSRWLGTAEMGLLGLGVFLLGWDRLDSAYLSWALLRWAVLNRMGSAGTGWAWLERTRL